MAGITFTCSKCEAEIEADIGLAGAVVQCPNCDCTVMIPMPGISPGMKIAGYEIVRRLGAGGMGEVWLANQTAMDRKVALKILSPALTSNKDFVDRFMKEVKTAAKLEHQNIVVAHYAGCEGNIYFLAMSYVDGALLDDLLKIDKRIPEKEALRIARGVADALRYAWGKFKILHRDIKPSNIMLDSDKIPKLMDMGISKSLSEDKGITMTGMIVGTPHYMSPEQANASSEIDCRADIYSLGATLYQLVTGVVPYDAPTAMAILMKHMSEPFPPPQGINPEVSDGCSVLLEIMMAKMPADRQASWEDVISDIDLVTAGKMPATRRPSAGKSAVMQETPSQQISRKKVLEDIHKPKKPLAKAALVSKQAQRPQPQARHEPEAKKDDSSYLSYVLTGVCATFAVLIVCGLIILNKVSNDRKPAKVDAMPSSQSSGGRGQAEPLSSDKKRLSSAQPSKIDAPPSGGRSQAEPPSTPATATKPAASSPAVASPPPQSTPSTLVTPANPATQVNQVKTPATSVPLDPVKWKDKKWWPKAASAAEQTKIVTEDCKLNPFADTSQESLPECEAASRRMLELWPDYYFGFRGVCRCLLLEGKWDDVVQIDKNYSSLRKSSGWTDFENAACYGLSGDTITSFNRFAEAFRRVEPEKLVIYGFGNNIYLFCLNAGLREGNSNSPFWHMVWKEKYLQKSWPVHMAVLEAWSIQGKDGDLQKTYADSISFFLSTYPDTKPLLDSCRKKLEGKKLTPEIIAVYFDEVAKEWKDDGTPGGLSQAEPQERLSTAQPSTNTAPAVDDATAEKMIKAAIEELKKKNPQQKEWKVYYRKEDAGWNLQLGSNHELKDISPLNGLPLKCLMLSSSQVSDISPLKGMPLIELVLPGTRVTDIGALRGMPLTKLNLTGVQVSDISPLKGMPLTSLHLESPQISDISVLEGMPLTVLVLQGVNVSDISLLKGMPLVELNLSSTTVSDISVLKGMPLVRLNLCGCKNLKDLTPLAECKQLKYLMIPDHCKDIEFLRNLPNLQFLDNNWNKTRSAAEFWKAWDAAKGKK